MKKQIESLIRLAAFVAFAVSAASASAQNAIAPKTGISQASQSRQAVKFTKVSDFTEPLDKICLFHAITSDIPIMKMQTRMIPTTIAIAALHITFPREQTARKHIVYHLRMHTIPVTICLRVKSYARAALHLIHITRGVTSKAVFWKPKNASANCYIVTATIDGKTLSRKFMIR